ncbi:glycosyltransferase family A protein [Lentibacillus halophilus]|uniref:Glycosyltransferase family A protein n=1 Tax=Lentibacillus halophilus TaxID=295065 RepID=A0ABP3IZI3_9BACI
MDLELLISTMHLNDYSILEKMNIQSKAIIINQCDENKHEEFYYNGNPIKFLSFAERGVGLSRNNALMRSTGDICLMADEDMIYVDNYKEKVINAFKRNPKADIIMFNVPIHKKDGHTIEKVEKDGRVRFYNVLKYGTVNIAFRRESVTKNNLFFSLLFGGGACYGSGEDSIFIVESIKKGLKIYSCKDVIAEIEENGSTWFEGYNENYFFDRGALFQAIGGNAFSLFLITQFLLRKRKLYVNELRTKEVFKEMIKGRKDFIKKGKAT